MALTATVYHLRFDLSDVDRGVYESLDLRVARHPSESMRYLLTRTFAYCLAYEEGIAFSKGLFSTDEPAVWVRHGDGRVKLWIDIGHPAIERIHKASKASDRVAIYTHHPVDVLRKEALAGRVHRGDLVEVCSIDVALLDALEPLIERNVSLSITRSDGHLYLTLGGRTLDGAITARPLLEGDD